jgi:CubicO group peptidase (beta-lactamase class C family)
MRYGIRSIAVIASLMCLAIALPAQKPPADQMQVETIRRMLKELHDNGEFTGSVLVARAGVVVYREAIAPTPADAAVLLTTPSNIGSVAKGFTAMAVMLLAERGKLSYDDLIGRHITDLAAASPGITIRHLLTHTSGIPDVGDLGVDRPQLREREVVNAVRTHHTRFVRPGAGYRYSNVGYILLAMAIENASGRTFDQFLQTEIFTPLGMTNTRPESGSRGPDDAKGYGGLVSTMDDLLKWDQALYAHKLVRAETFNQALMPVKVTGGESRYGFGWNVAQRDGDTFMWHTGNTGAERAFLGRRLKDRIAIIILSRGNSRRTEIADAIVNILHGRPHEPPKLSIARRLLPVIEADGVDAAFALYQQLRTTPGTRYDFSEPELNGLGYTLLDSRKHDAAIRVFQLNLRQFPTSANAFDSLGEAFFRSGRRAEAAQAYERAVELDPGNANARAMLLKLK